MALIVYKMIHIIISDNVQIIQMWYEPWSSFPNKIGSYIETD